MYQPKKKNAYEFTKSENAASQQVPYRIGGIDPHPGAGAANRRDMLCGNWESVEGKPDVLIYKEGEAYKVTVFRRSGLRRKLKPETYLLQEENGNLFMNTGFRIDVSYNEATDVLTFSPNGDYVRVKPQPGHPTEE